MRCVITNDGDGASDYDWRYMLGCGDLRRLFRKDKT